MVWCAFTIIWYGIIERNGMVFAYHKGVSCVPLFSLKGSAVLLPKLLLNWKVIFNEFVVDDTNL